MAAKILLVEDDNNLREIYEARLQAEGYTIVTAKDGEEALVVAKAEQPNLVISDVMMPRISGFEMLDILRNTEDLKDTKVIMLTALGQADDKTRANSLGADRYLVKSQVTLEDIVKAAHELVDSGKSSATAPQPAMAAPAAAAPTMPPTPSQSMAGPAPVFDTPAPQPTAADPAPNPVLTSMMGAASMSASMPPAPGPAPAMTPSSDPAPATPAMPATPTPTPPSAPAADAANMFGAPQPAATPDATTLPSPTTAEEKATVDTQINNFVQHAGDMAAPAATPATNTATQDDAVLATAMNDLAQNTEKPAAEATPGATEPAAPVAAPSSTPETPAATQDTSTDADTSHGSVPIANKKVIQPLNSEPKQSIHELLAKEEAKDAMGQAPTPPMPGTAPAIHPDMLNTTPPAPTPQVGNVFGPSTPPAASPQPPAGPSDPNNIAL